MAAVLDKGMRAISTEISPETGAGGFILPNDRVDVILSKRDREAEKSGAAESHISETILSNIRILAIDQTLGEKDGQKVVIGKTATLELTPRQSETLALSRQLGTLSLALRSLADAGETTLPDDGAANRRAGNQHGALRHQHHVHVEVSCWGTSNMSTRNLTRAALGVAVLAASLAAAFAAEPMGVPAQSGSIQVVRLGFFVALRAARHRQVGRDRPAARHQGCAGRRTKIRQRGRAFDAARLPDRRRRRPDQHLFLRCRRPADRGL
jgi:Flp pilus assembly protein CpaB